MNITALVNPMPNLDTFKGIKKVTDKTKEIAFLNKNNSPHLDSFIPQLSKWGVDFGTQGIIKHAPINLCINLTNAFEGTNEENSYIAPIHPIMVVSQKPEMEHDIDTVNKTVLDIAAYTSVYSPMTDDVGELKQSILDLLKKNSVTNSYMHSIINDYKNWALLGFSEDADILAVYYAMTCITLTRKSIQ